MALGSFRGAEFIVTSDDEPAIGRRTQVHIYPGRDEPWVEDLGKQGRQFSLECFVTGDDYLNQASALRDALEMPGAGTLIHPLYGTLSVFIVGARKRLKTSRRRVEFTVTFIVASELIYPAASNDTASKVVEAADALQAAGVESYTDRFDVTGQSADYVDGVVAEVAKALADVDVIVGSVSGPIADLVRSPADMASAIVDGVAQISATIAEPAEALRIYESIIVQGLSIDVVAGETAASKQQAANTEMLYLQVHLAMLLSAARSAAEVDFVTRDDAIATMERWVAGAEEHMEWVSVVDGSPIDGDVYVAISDLRTAIADDLRDRGATLPRLRSYTPPATLPALVVAQRLYGDGGRANEIIDRNRIDNPAFVPGGAALEVLDV